MEPTKFFMFLLITMAIVSPFISTAEGEPCFIECVEGFGNAECLKLCERYDFSNGKCVRQGSEGIQCCCNV
ncbi:hypothetical protein L6164_013134 [Bauhinia variegata]|uniref:Uncharacterized protein n=1 Tax=Bauhinia variegata TaxID=167791 RepID=A0ACB9PDD1_BAUVA|nr:hypothetical protein L6164_013134 [Bauhinia variegata]